MAALILTAKAQTKFRLISAIAEIPTPTAHSEPSLNRMNQCAKTRVEIDL